MLKARAVTARINPSLLPIRLGGYAADIRAYSVESDLEANCLFLTDGRQSVVLVSLDLLYVTHALREAVLEGIEDLGIEGRDVFLAASHTHYAPAIDETKPKLGAPEIAWRNEIVDTVVRTIRDAALGPKTGATLATATASVPIGMNRRKKRLLRVSRSGIEFNKAGMSPNPRRSTDSEVSVIEVRAEGRGPLAFIWSGACHPTARGQAHMVSADWPGVVRANLRELARAESQHTAETPVLFLQGFSGDVRPPSGEIGKRSAKALLQRMLMGRCFAPMDSSEYATWANSASEAIAAIAKRCSPYPCDANLDSTRIEVPASRFAQGAEHLPPVSFHRVVIGPVVIVGASAELVSGYAATVRSLAPGKHVIPVGCIDHVISYWPLQYMFREGGYEVVHHCPSFGITACDPDIEARVLEQFRLLWNKEP